ncbi:uncharacterized protein LOC115919321 [Strongylocentrotus purpuratus]|uniref:Uncharacterized protein n=1 Tax=Strongylocentrotus purpuratus TaxID=7668 RepID=A0A7M7MZB9_STRPU|nr:uncharacterized protein LOC115919321 [Strongylocentrotus purpuratus]
MTITDKKQVKDYSAYTSGRMEDVCLNPNEDVSSCGSCLRDFATLPDKPSWCVDRPPQKNLLALWIILLLLAFAVCCILCYCFWRKIWEWILITRKRIIDWIDNIRNSTDTPDSPPSPQSIPLDGGKENDNIAPEKGDKKETSPMLPKKDTSENSPTPV